MTPEQEEEYKRQKTLEKYGSLQWSREEMLLRTRSKFRYIKLIKNKVPVSLVLRLKLRKSCFGRFMKTFNEDQQQNFFLNINKVGIEDWDIHNHDETDAEEWVYNHNFVDDAFELLKTAVHTEECVDYDFIYNNLKGLRLTDCQINYVDSMIQFASLKVLILAGNWIKKIAGKKLPKQLEFLECFVNEISNITQLCEECPTRIKHLGLGRNKLSEDSCCHLLSTSGNFTELSSLDLSNNDFSSLTNLLDQLQGLPRLITLNLEGNPCYTCEMYKEKVLKTFPRLLYLDETKILPEDRHIEDNCGLEEGSALIFICYRLIGIPPPPKGAVVHTYHLEVELPLLEEIKIPVPKKPKQEPKKEEEVKPKEIIGKKAGKGKDAKKGKDVKKEKKPKSEKSSKVPKPAKGKGLYALPNEYEYEVQHQIINNNFKTETREWDTVIKYNNPSIIVHTPDNNLQLLRDTFRSQVKVKIVYTQKFVQKKAKKGKKDKKKTPSEAGSEIPDEIILKKSTFAIFYCDLHSVNWSDQYVDFLWADFPVIQDRAIAVEGSLKPDIYLEGKKKGKGKGKDKDKGNSKSNKSSNKSGKSKGAKSDVPEKLPLPTKLTCHVGFGIKRHGMTQEIVAFKKSKKKE